MSDLVAINKRQFLTRLYETRHGTGTIATAAGVGPDEIQALLHSEAGSEKLVGELVRVLGDSILAEVPVVEEELEEVEETVKDDGVELERKTIDELLTLVEEGRVSRSTVLEFENSQDRPRKTLIAALEGE